MRRLVLGHHVWGAERRSIFGGMEFSSVIFFIISSCVLRYVCFRHSSFNPEEFVDLPLLMMNELSSRTCAMLCDMLTWETSLPSYPSSQARLVLNSSGPLLILLLSPLNPLGFGIEKTEELKKIVY